MSVLTKDLIKLSEEKAVSDGTFSFRELMLTAGSLAAKEILNVFPVEGKRLAVVCGKGNNGGDGCVIAKLLSDKGGIVTLVTPFGVPQTEDAAFYYSQLDNVEKSATLKGEYDLIVDAIFGIGYKAKDDIGITEIFTAVNRSNAFKISIDIPSGVECDSGRVVNTAVKADLTFTFIALKPCFMLPSGNEYCERVRVIDIGVKPLNKAYEIIREPVFAKRPKNSHKGTFGTALLICGSYGMAGAAMLSAKAALRSGLGIAKCVIPKGIYEAFTSFLPEAVCLPLKQTKKGTVKFNSRLFTDLITNCDAILFGCGCKTEKETERILKFLIKSSEKPLVIDADGINTLAKSIDILKTSKAPIILTPHPAEMARLCKTSVAAIEGDRPYYAKLLAQSFGCTVVLKGANTVVAHKNGNVSFNIIGNSGMATGGSGDVLAGVIVSLLAQGYSEKFSAESGVYLHSLAGDKAAGKRSRHALLPTDIIEEL